MVESLVPTAGNCVNSAADEHGGVIVVVVKGPCCTAGDRRLEFWLGTRAANLGDELDGPVARATSGRFLRAGALRGFSFVAHATRLWTIYLRFSCARSGSSRC